MTKSTKAVQNYFNALDQFLDSWLHVFNKTLKDTGESNELISAGATGFTNLMQEYLNQIEDFTVNQVKDMESMDPKQYQQEMLASLKDFKSNFEQITSQVMDQLDKEEEYVASPQFLEDYEKNMKRSNSFYVTWVNSLTNLIEAYNNALKNA